MSASSPESSPDPSHSYSTEGFTPVYVKAWGALALPFTLNENESAYWEFRTQAHDIAFGVEFVESTNGSKKTTVEPMTRIPKPDQLLQHGSYQAKQAGTLTLTWDNTYSKLRGKNLLYRVRVLAPEVDHNALPFGDVRLTPYGPATIEGVREEDGIFIVSLPYGQGYFTSSTLLQSPTLARPPSINERCLIGVNMFFNNRVWESESFFRKDVEKYPIFSLAYGSLGFLRALMTWDKSDIGEANSRLKQTRHFVAALLPQVSTMKSVGRFFARSNGPTMTPQELECSLLQAEAYLLQAMLLFTDESYMSFIKAGLKIRSAWKLYEKCDEQVRCYDESTRASLDASVVGGIKFGIGCFNVIISILPSIILRVVSALGFPSDRALGLRLLTECSNVVGVRQPLAYLMLSFVYVIMPSFFTVRPKHHIKNATDVLNQAYKQYPSGALFLWMDGRLQRLKRDLPQAIQRFTRSAQGQPDWLQLQHLCAYELGFCYFFSLDFVKSSAYWARLEKENTWSKGFFAYMQGICEMSSDHGLTKTANESDADFKKRLWSAQQNAALPILSKVESLVTRKFGGKPLAIEAFVVHRSNMFVKENRRPAIPELEMIYLFYGFIQMSEALLDKSLQMVDTVLRDARSPRPDGGQPLTTEEIALVLLVRAAILKALHRWNEAKAILTELDRKKDVEFTAEKYVLPFSRFELAALLMEQVVEKDAAVADGAAASIDQSIHTMAADGWSTVPSGGDISPIGSSDWEEARLDLLNQAHAILKKCESNKTDYPFKNRLHLRIHLASVELSMMKKHWQEIGSVYSSADLKGDEEAIKAVVDSEEEEEGKE